MSRHVEILSQEQVFQRAIFKIVAARLRLERYDGTMSDPIDRLSLERGDSVAALLYDPDRDEVVLTEQFRYPTHEKGPGWLLEIPAGMVEVGDTPEDTIRRELVEEIGYEVEALEPISTFYVSPGGSSERITVYYVEVERRAQTGVGGGLAHEGEDIRTVVMSRVEAMAGLAGGTIADAKTVIGLQWLALKLWRTRQG